MIHDQDREDVLLMTGGSHGRMEAVAEGKGVAVTGHVDDRVARVGEPVLGAEAVVGAETVVVDLLVGCLLGAFGIMLVRRVARPVAVVGHQLADQQIARPAGTVLPEDVEDPAVAMGVGRAHVDHVDLVGRDPEGRELLVAGAPGDRHFDAIGIGLEHHLGAAPGINRIRPAGPDVLALPDVGKGFAVDRDVDIAGKDDVHRFVARQVLLEALALGQRDQVEMNVGAWCPTRRAGSACWRFRNDGPVLVAFFFSVIWEWRPETGLQLSTHFMMCSPARHSSPS